MHMMFFRRFITTRVGFLLVWREPVARKSALNYMASASAIKSTLYIYVAKDGAMKINFIYYLAKADAMKIDFIYYLAKAGATKVDLHLSTMVFLSYLSII